MALDPVKNFAISKVATAPSPADSGTTIVVDTGDGALFPAPATSGEFNVVIYPNGEQPDSSNAEIVRVTARTSDTFTIVRQQEGTSARTIVEGDVLMLGITAKVVADIQGVAEEANEKAEEAQEEVSGIIDIILPQIRSGWITAEETWTRTSNTTFTIAGDKRDKYQKGDKIKLTQSGNTKYFYIIGIAYSSPNTTITVTGGSDYSLASATITEPYFSKVENPQGHPVWFDWIPTIGGVTGGSITLAKFRIIGNQVFLAINFGGSGSPAFVTFTGPLPYSPTGGPAYWAGGARVEDTSGATAGYWQHQGSNVFRVYKVGSVAFNSSGGVILQLFYEY